MSGSIDQIEFVSLPVHSCRSQFDGDASFLLDIHTVQHLIVIDFSHSSRHLQHPIGKRGFSVVYMSDDTKVTNLHKWEQGVS
jgi:hypothetical protein